MNPNITSLNVEVMSSHSSVKSEKWPQTLAQALSVGTNHLELAGASPYFSVFYASQNCTSVLYPEAPGSTGEEMLSLCVTALLLAGP